MVPKLVGTSTLGTDEVGGGSEQTCMQTGCTCILGVGFRGYGGRKGAQEPQIHLGHHWTPVTENGLAKVSSGDCWAEGASLGPKPPALGKAYRTLGILSDLVALRDRG